MQTEFSLSNLISSVIGSELTCPQSDPVEQLDAGGVVNMFVVVWITVECVVSGVVFSPPPPPCIYISNG